MRQLSGTASGILSYFARHRTAANLLLVLMLVWGISSATQIRSQFFPDVIIDSVTVSVGWQGAGPEDVDQSIVALLEPALLTVEGVESTRSVAREGSARISLDFEANWDMARAADDVKVAVDSVTGLPDDIDEPVVRRNVWRDRVTDVIIHGPVAPEQLGRFADEFAAKLFRAGITRTTIRGVDAPEIIIEAPETELIQNNLTLRDIANAISQEAEADPAGDVAGGAARVRTGVAKQSAETIEQIVIRSRSDGSKLRVGDVTDIRVTGTDANRSYFVNGSPAVSVRVDRANDGDAIEMQAQVQAVADELQRSLPNGVKIELIRTRAQAISDRLGLLMSNAAMGLALVVVLLFIFLSARTAFWVAAGIPVALFAAIGLMYTWGLTLNMVSMFGLIITLGIVVDDAIVVGEHADFRARRLGERPIEAAENAARRMAPPVFSATLTTIIAFWSLTLIGGRFGTLIADIPFTVIVVLAASLVECFIILPNHMSHSLGHLDRTRWYDLPSFYFNLGFKYVREAYFKPLMGWVLYLRYPLFAALTLLLAFMVTFYMSGAVQFRFFSPPERNSASGNIAMLESATRADTAVMVQELQRAVDATGKTYEDKYGRNPIVFSMTEIGGNSGRGLASAANKDRDLLGSVAIELIDVDARPYSAFDFIGDLQDEVRRHPKLEEISFRGFRFGPGGDSLDVQFTGQNSVTLKAAAEAFKTALTQFPEVSAVEDDLPYDKEELVLELTPQGQALGFSIDDIGIELRNRLNGITAASFPAGGRTTDVTVRLPEASLTNDFLDRTMLRSPSGQFVPLADLVSVQTKLGFSTILRENGLRLVSVTGEIPEDDPDRATEITNTIRNDILPNIATEYGVEFRLSGQAEQEREFLSEALIGFMLCLLGIYLSLTWIFASWTRPIVVMAVIPFGAIGMIYGHYVFAVPLSMFSIVGFIGMTGIIINDSIVLVTTIDEYAKRRAILPAVIEACADRLRAVMLTTLTTVLGLTPLLFERSAQAQFLKPTVITLVFGLGFGMFIVLLLVPSLVMMQQDFKATMRSYLRLLRARRGAGRFVLIGASVLSAGWIGAIYAFGGFGLALNLALAIAGVLLILLLGYVIASLYARITPRVSHSR